MFKTTILITLLLVLCAADARAQWIGQTSGTNVRLRGVSAVNGRVAWASGAGGTYARTTDGGRTWQTGQVPGAAELDFRDVDAFDAETAYLLAIGEGERSRIYKTTDGGRNWTLQFQNRRAAAFYDCMAFWDASRGIAMSDPVDGRFLVVKTEDGGRTWKEVDPAGMPPALEGEGGFAASGTCVAVGGAPTHGSGRVAPRGRASSARTTAAGRGGPRPRPSRAASRRASSRSPSGRQRGRGRRRRLHEGAGFGRERRRDLRRRPDVARARRGANAPAATGLASRTCRD